MAIFVLVFTHDVIPAPQKLRIRAQRRMASSRGRCEAHAELLIAVATGHRDRPAWHGAVSIVFNYADY